MTLTKRQVEFIKVSRELSRMKREYHLRTGSDVGFNEYIDVVLKMPLGKQVKAMKEHLKGLTR